MIRLNDIFKGKAKINKRTIVIICAAVIVLIAGIILTVSLSNSRNKNNNSYDEFIGLAEDIPEGIQDNPFMAKGIIEHIVNAGQVTKKALAERPSSVELTIENTEEFLNITDCIIDNGQVNLSFSSEGIPKSDDKYYYMFAINSYDDTRELANYEYVSKSYKREDGSLTCQLLLDSPESRLYKKFGVAVKIDDEFVLVGQPSFVTNPEAIASHTGVYMSVPTKKGILIDYNRVFTGELEDLGIRQIAMNIPLSSIMGPSTNPLFPSIHYSYNGQTYTFNGTVIAGFDTTIATMTQKGIQTTAIILNDYTNAYINLIHPDARSYGVCPYYMFNGSTDEGVELLAAVGAFLADRYSGDKHGRVSNWVIANEINARKEWNYLKYTDVDTYSREFAKGYRVLYTAIKSTSSSARVFISLDQNWKKNLANSPDYDGKDVLDCFNDYIKKYGNIDWSLAYHPYNVPLTSCKSWAPSGQITHTEDTPSISMQNIDVLVDYMNQEKMLSPNGECRSIMITELGYTSTGGEQLQAAAIAYAYYKVAHYDDIDGLLLNRETDDATEIAQGLATGITTSAGGHKASYNVYKYSDTEQWEQYYEFAKSIIGINSWDEIMR